MDSAAGAPLEEIRSQAQKEVETNYLIMTIVKTFSFLSIYDLRQTLLFYWNHLAL